MARTSSGEATPVAAKGAPTVRSPNEPLPPEGLYVHFPFCVSLCPYCDFVVVAGQATRGPQNRIDGLLQALQVELELRVGDLEATTPLDTVYFGGGTPSLMSAEQVAHLLEAIDRQLGIATEAEVTLEANPGRDEIGDLAGFRAAGINRLSIGAQSLDDVELKRLGRRHRSADVGAAVTRARGAGFDSVSLDLLTDIPGQTLASWRSTLERVLALEPDHLSAYSLTLDDPEAEGLTGADGDHLPLSRGARAWRERARAGQSEERAAAMESLTDELAGRAGLLRYEIANLARPGRECRHNLLYWRRRPYLALGPGAHAFDGARRRTWNAARLDRYLEALGARALPPGGAEAIDAASALAESAILALRTRDGIGHTTAAEPALEPALTWAREHDLLDEVAGRTRLTARGRLLADEVFVRLLPGDKPVEAGSRRGG